MHHLAQRNIRGFVIALFCLASGTMAAQAQRTVKPVLHGQHWVAITGKPLGATAGAMVFQQGGNAVDAAAAMLGATATMFDVLSWGGETQALPRPWYAICRHVDREGKGWSVAKQ